MPKYEDSFKRTAADYSDFSRRLLWNRGLKERKEIEDFLDGGLERLNDPFLFKDMEAAVERIIFHIKKGNKIFVYGDYDADGVTSSALISEILGLFKAKTGIYIPDRVSEGYGMNKESIDYISEKGASLILTVDGGIRNKKEVEYASSKGLEVIITDHHVAPEKTEDIPDCLILDPVLPKETYPDKKIAGVGVAFKLASALIRKSKLNIREKAVLEERLLDLAAIGTVADCVELRGENRIFVKEGIRALERTKRPGIVKLMEKARINRQKSIDSWNIGFQIAPRLNAAGRMDHASAAYELLVSRDPAEAEVLAERLNENNIDRQRATDEILMQVEKQIDPKNDKIMIGVFDSESDDKIWNEGVVGLVAGKISSKYYRPALVITKAEGAYKGSGRGIPEFNVIKAVEEAGEYLEKYGGHPAACGFSLKEANLGKFMEKMRFLAEDKLKRADLRPKIDIEHELKFNEIDAPLYEELREFSPFGQGNSQPVFSSRGIKIMDIVNMGSQGEHLKLRLKQDDSRVLNALGFNQSQKWPGLAIGGRIDLAYYLDENEFNGRREIQLKIIDIKYTD